MRKPWDQRALRHRLSRRELVRAGVLSSLGLGLPSLLQADTQLNANSPKSCIFIHQNGGLSQLDSWDPKPNAPPEVRGPDRPIATATPRIFVNDLMPRLAHRSQDYAIILSMTHRVPEHDVANRMLLAGQSLPTTDAPAFGSIVTKLKPVTAAVPPYVWLQKFGGGAMPPEASDLTGGFLGMGHAPMLIGATPDDHPTITRRQRAFACGHSIRSRASAAGAAVAAERDGPRTAHTPAAGAAPDVRGVSVARI